MRCTPHTAKKLEVANRRSICTDLSGRSAAQPSKNLNISKPDASEEDTYEIKYDLIINLSMDEWEEVDEKFKTAAKEREVEVEFLRYQEQHLTKFLN